MVEPLAEGDRFPTLALRFGRPRGGNAMGLIDTTKRFLALVLPVLLMTSAFASEKLIDTSDVQSAAQVSITGTLGGGSPTWNRTYNNIDPPDPTCNRPSSDSFSDGMYYGRHCIQVSSTDPIEIVVSAAGTTISDTVMYLFCVPFDPSNPADRQVFSDDDDGDGLLSAFTLADNVVLTPGIYDLVISTFSAGATGDYVIDTSLNVTECGPVPVDDATFGTIKAQYR
jgi:hypothetical protein